MALIPEVARVINFLTTPTFIDNCAQRLGELHHLLLLLVVQMDIIRVLSEFRELGVVFRSGAKPLIKCI
jgi:hypothetical protein